MGIVEDFDVRQDRHVIIDTDGDPSQAPILAPIRKIVVAEVIQRSALGRTVDQVIGNAGLEATLPV